jgi:hypothetical protein
MYERIFRQMQKAVRAGRVFFTPHARTALRDDGFTADDALHCILTGEIVEDQFDLRYRQVKYIIYGDSQTGDEMGLIARWDDRKGVVVITVYHLGIDDYE